MGKRYQAILKYQDVPFECLDLDNLEDGPALLSKAEKIIIATPTDTHLNLISMVAPYKVPVLCEKPITKSRDELLHLEQIAKTHSLNLTMMMQYSELPGFAFGPQSYYNYFRHGNDGLIWDCMQIIVLHKGRHEDLVLHEKSPVWECKINGRWVDLREMDLAYIDFVSKWLTKLKTSHSMEYLIQIHDKVRAYEEHCNAIRNPA